MEYLQNCPSCGGVASKEPFLNSRDHMVSDATFQIVKCPECSLLYTNPRPEAQSMGQYYQSEDYISHTESKRGVRERIYHIVRSEMLRRKRKLIEILLPGPKRVLDVGCGTGAFLKALENTENEVIGYEPAPEPRQKARNKGIRVLSEEKELEQLLGIDIITLWHVLEHMPDFRQKLELFHRQLNPGGFIVIAVPLWQSFDAVFYKDKWAAWDLPRHLLHFDSPTLIRACSNAGFTFHQTNALPFDAYYISLLSEKYKANRLGPLRAMIVGTWSGLLAMAGRRPWSSQIFVFRKQ